MNSKSISPAFIDTVLNSTALKTQPATHSDEQNDPTNCGEIAARAIGEYFQKIKLNQGKFDQVPHQRRYC